MAGFEIHSEPMADAVAQPRPTGEAAAPYDAQRRLDLLHAVIDLLPVGVRVDGADGRVVLANAAAAQLPPETWRVRRQGPSHPHLRPRRHRQPPLPRHRAWGKKHPSASRDYAELPAPGT